MSVALHANTGSRHPHEGQRLCGATAACTAQKRGDSASLEQEVSYAGAPPPQIPLLLLFTALSHYQNLCDSKVLNSEKMQKNALLMCLYKFDCKVLLRLSHLWYKQ